MWCVVRRGARPSQVRQAVPGFLFVPGQVPTRVGALHPFHLTVQHLIYLSIFLPFHYGYLLVFCEESIVVCEESGTEESGTHEESGEESIVVCEEPLEHSITLKTMLFCIIRLLPSAAHEAGHSTKTGWDHRIRSQPYHTS